MLGSLPNEKKTTYLVNVPSGMFHLVGLLKQKHNMSTYSKIHTYIAFLLFGNYTCFLSLYLKLIYYMLIQSWRWRLHIPECKFKIKSIFSTGRELKKSKCSCPLVWKRKKKIPSHSIKSLQIYQHKAVWKTVPGYVRRMLSLYYKLIIYNGRSVMWWVALDGCSCCSLVS